MASANLDLVRSILAALEKGDFTRAPEWAHSEIEVLLADGPSPGSWHGVAGLAEVSYDFLRTWEDLSVETPELRELDAERVLVLVHFSGRGKTSGLELAQLRQKTAMLFHIRDGKVTRVVGYMNAERAFADLGLAREAGLQRS